MDEEDVIDDQAQSNEDAVETQPEEDVFIDAKKQLKECQKEKQKIEIEYYKCEKELNLKTEECEKLKIMIKDLKEIAQLKDKIEEINEDGVKEDSPREVETEGEENPWITKKSVKRPGPRGVKTSDCDKEYNCSECDFQVTTEMQLKKHVNLKHTTRVHVNDQIECRICGEDFDAKWKFMNHRKAKHITSVAQCTTNIEGRCTFSAAMCWWKHEERKTNPEENVDCFVCNETFKSKTELMIHRKKEHFNIVRQCLQFSENNCRYQEKSCWYKHGIEHRNNDISNQQNKEVESSSVFQKASMNKKPPIPKQNANLSL